MTPVGLPFVRHISHTFQGFDISYWHIDLSMVYVLQDPVHGVASESPPKALTQHHSEPLEQLVSDTGDAAPVGPPPGVRVRRPDDSVGRESEAGPPEVVRQPASRD